MIELTTEKINVDAVLEHVEDNSTGGVVLFLGRVRDHNEGKTVQSMNYEAHASMAKAKLAEVEVKTKKRWPVTKMYLVHRIGTLKLADVSVAIAVACSHRKDAFEACRFAIDMLKETVPIWKKEYFEDGESWVEGVQPKL